MELIQNGGRERERHAEFNYCTVQDYKTELVIKIHWLSRMIVAVVCSSDIGNKGSLAPEQEP